MPVLPTPDYQPPLPFLFGNLATVYPPLFRLTPLTAPEPERIELADTDFLDLDWHRCRTGETRGLAIVSHGLEGNSRKKYMLGMARMATGAGWDTVCWSQRGCSSEPNRLPRSYHSGETDDLHEVILHCLSTGRYDRIVLIGFSMGGNQILKYLGEAPDRVPAQVAAAATFSVPCDLSAAERIISRHRIYFEYFMKGLRSKMRDKGVRFPDVVNASRLKGIRTLREFDDRFTAPMGGFLDANDYYTRASSLQFLKDIRIPTLLVTAQDDPFMAPSCYPVLDATTNPKLFLEMPRYGGHVGFVLGGRDNVYWSECRTKAFLDEIPG
ncbi:MULTISPECIES: alpha/beta fold hydrolase [unclassified Pseudodesulfovibrio]|uniref:YheT family hydrolase n=1 Tax=unclassified Pseudodesulfovibrio TaxID=2661612 RepID=UPI000FEB6717|nr:MULTISPECIES: alpha/beta fold hydrolase [unclassified Pseudodesulfovibrio]MCJ2162976.1 alpha/beta fold hydrolase [Pseudodesulfovibrio sp. S3-i]RWU06974.1 alpha/beta fold hydrolase [Pseudodesulfovibrio sp. S3]